MAKTVLPVQGDGFCPWSGKILHAEWPEKKKKMLVVILCLEPNRFGKSRWRSEGATMSPQLQVII